MVCNGATKRPSEKGLLEGLSDNTVNLLNLFHSLQQRHEWKCVENWFKSNLEK